MRIADKYISKEFILSFLWSLLSLVAIYIIVDIFENISTYVAKEASFFSIVQYYVYSLPLIIGTIISPVACLLGCFISVGNLSRHFEIVALKSSGLSLYRILAPLIFMGLILSILVLIMNETLLPRANERGIALKREQIEKRPQLTISPAKDIYYSGESNRFYHIKFIDPQKGIIKGLTIYEFIKGHTLKRRIDAPRALWKGSHWELFNGSERIFKPNSFEVIYFDTLIIHLNETPLELVKGTKPDLSMGFFEFKEHIEKLQRSGEDVRKQLVDLYVRLSFPFMNLIIILLGIPLASKVRSLGFIMGFAIALFASFIYWGLLQFAKAFGHTGILPPLGASLLPNLVFIIAGLILLWIARK